MTKTGNLSSDAMQPPAIVSQAQEVKQDSDVWFEDGNVVIVAQNIGFCVHRSVLSHRSPIFCDVFSTGAHPPPDNSTTAETFSGLPVVHVSDNADDMRFILRAIYDGRKYLRQWLPLVPINMLFALMRLGHKYELPDLVDDAAHYLGDYYTPDFRAWLEYRNKERTSNILFSDPEADDLEVINLARLIGRSELLPIALYHACQLPLSQIIHGASRSPEGNLVRLSPSDVERCVQARERLLRESLRIAHHVVAQARPCPDCNEHCAATLKSMSASVFVELFEWVTTAPLAHFDEQLSAVAGSAYWKDVCSKCQGAIFDAHTFRQRDTWGRLLEIFDLEGDPYLARQWRDPAPLWYTGWVDSVAA